MSPDSTRDLGTELRRIGERARWLSEILGSSGDSPPTRAIDPDSVLARWQQALGADRSGLQRRLSWDGLEIADVRERLAASPLEKTYPWTTELAEWAKVARQVATELRSGALPESGLSDIDPFGPVWVPCLRRAVARLDSETSPSARRLLSSSARDACLKYLYGQLCRLGVGVLYQQLERRRASGNGAYQDLVLELLDGGLIGLFAEHSALARRAHILCQAWVGTVSLLLERLAADLADLSSWLGVDLAEEPSGVVQSIETGLSDPHFGGRWVAILELRRDSADPGAGTVKVVYKPRGMALEIACYELFGWLDDEGFAQAPPRLQILDRQSYGWVEFAEQHDFLARDEVESYFETAGALLFLSHLLGGNDLHCENLVALRGGPVLIDMESFLQPPPVSPGPRADSSAVAQAGDVVKSSFLSTGMLSFLRTDAEGQAYDVGGLCGLGGHVVSTKHLEWRDINTDAMKPHQVTLFGEEKSNVVQLDGVKQSPADHSEALARGFEAAYRFVIAKRDELRAADGPLAAFESLRSRIILRPTHVYAMALSRLRATEYQQLGIAGGLLVETLNRFFADSQERPKLWPLVASEAAALERLDVPYLSARGRALIGDGGESIDGFYPATGLDALKRRLDDLDEAGLNRDLGLLGTALARASSLVGRRATAADLDEEPIGSPPELTSEHCLAAALGIAEQLEAMAVVGEDSSRTWIGPAALAGGGGGQGEMHYMYGGSSGIALFFGALYSRTREPRFREVSLGALRIVGQLLGDPQAARVLRAEGVGGFNGLGSLVYALSVLRTLIDEPVLGQWAERLVAVFDDDRVSRDVRLDVEGGSAGAILALVALHRASGSDAALVAAQRCAEHLLSRQQPASPRGAAWPWKNGVCLLGYAHGTSGISHALAELGRLAPDARISDAVASAIDYEDSWLDDQLLNWPVLQAEPVERARLPYLKAWCHGAPGVALGRLLVSATTGEPSPSLDAALETTASAQLLPVDHLCCGNLGHVAILREAARRLDRRDLARASRQKLSAVLARAESSSGYRLADGGAQSDPGLMRGLAGIGYELLRQVTAPGRPELPNVLFLEPVGGGS